MQRHLKHFQTDLTISGQVSFAWYDSSAEGNTNTTDKVMVLVYNLSKKESMYILDGTVRPVGTQNITTLLAV